MKEFVAYIRVSTKMQKASGLGIEAQQTVINNYVNDKGVIIKSFIEVESGRKKNRILLTEAVRLCKDKGYILIVSKLDRLGRNASQLFEIRDSIPEDKLIICDMLNNNTITFGMYATLCQWEAEQISDRTHLALQELKLQGVILGSPTNTLTDEIRKKSIDKKKKDAFNNENWQRANLICNNLRTQGKSLRAIADTINQSGFRTRENKLFTAQQVKRVLAMNFDKE